MSEQKVIVITGATAGIGRHAALYLAERGHRVIASGRRQGALDELRKEGAAKGWLIDTVRLDVTDDASIRAAHERIAEITKGGAVDVLINNAGYGLAAPLAEVTDKDLRHQFDTNVFGLMAVSRAFLGDMIARRSGRIINVSSIGGRITFPMMGAYHASKYAVEALSDALRMELAPFGVHVSLIEPGPIQTEFIDNMHAAMNPYRDGSLYEPIFEQSEAIESKAMAMAPGPKVISRAIHRAVTSRRPKARYVAPFSSHLMLRVMSWIPVPLRDRLMRAVFGLTRRRFADAQRPTLQAA